MSTNNNPIKDSGSRTHYNTGAVRDIRIGKGRMDLVPLDIANALYNFAPFDALYLAQHEMRSLEGDNVFTHINHFIYHGDCDALIAAMLEIITQNYVFFDKYLETAAELGVSIDEKNVMLRHVVAHAIIMLSQHFENGAIKYEPRNWEKGIDLNAFIDSGARHYAKVLSGFDDEPHHLAALWNLMCAVWTYRNKPELNNLPCAQK